eukprot:m.519350 g.519350  ORF g.519350 m.519350 type:complete len:307 (-) comp21944_c0_seq3:1978-2898(-)
MDIPSNTDANAKGSTGDSFRIAGSAAVTAAVAYVALRRALVYVLMPDITKASPQQVKILRAAATEKTGKILCMVHCAITSFGGYKIVEECAHDILNASSTRISTYGGISTAYMFCDLLSMFINYREGIVVAGGGGLKHALKEGMFRQPAQARTFLVQLAGFWHSQWLYIVHHIVLAVVFIPVGLFLSRGHYVAGKIMLCEVSNLVRLLRWFVLHTPAVNNKFLDIGSGVALTLSWFVTRIWVFPAMYVAFAKQQQRDGVELPFWESVGKLRWYCHAGNAAILAPQLYWFWLIGKGWMREFGKSKTA